MYKRKTMLWASALIMSIGLVACGGSGNDETVPDSTSSSSSSSSGGGSSSSSSSGSSSSSSGGSSSSSSGGLAAGPAYTVATQYNWGGSYFPMGLTRDTAGNFYVAMGAMGQAPGIDKLPVSGGSTALVAADVFKGPTSVALNPLSGYLTVVDETGRTVWSVSTTGSTMLLAGDGNSGTADGVGTAARFVAPRGLVYDSKANAFITDAGARTIRKLDTSKTTSTFAGSGAEGNTDGTGKAASFNVPSGITVDAQDNLYVADYKNNAIRKITPAGVVTTYASGIDRPLALTMAPDGRLFVTSGGRVVMVAAGGGSASIIAGSATTGTLVNGVGQAARFGADSLGIYFDAATGKVYVADSYNAALRVLTPPAP